MRFGLTDDQRLLRQTAEAWIARELPLDTLRAMDAAGQPVHASILPALAHVGFTGVALPPEHGGTGGGTTDAVILLETVGRASLSVAEILISAIGFGTGIVRALGDDERQRRLLPAVAEGRATFASALTDPDPQAAPAALRIRFRLAGDGYVLDGSGTLVRGAAEATHLLVAARAVDGDDEAVTLFVVDPRTAGIRLRPIETIGLHAAGRLYELRCEGLRVPPAAVLGEPGKAWRAIEAALRVEHLLEAAACVGCAQQVIDDAVRYANERRQFDQPIGKFQAIAHLLADLQVQVDGARLLAMQAAWLVDAGRDAVAAVAMARLACNEAILETTSQAMRVYGGYGLTMAFDVQRAFRDARRFVTGSGASRLQRDAVAADLGLAQAGWP